MPASAITRFPTSTLRPDGVTGKNKQNEMMERISKQAIKLRGAFVTSSAVPYALLVPNALQGRGDALEQLTVRLGVIPIASFPTATSLQANLAAFPADRAGPETITLTGGTAPQVYTAPNPNAAAVAFTAGGAAQAVTAADSNDAAAKGRALVDILP